MASSPSDQHRERVDQILAVVGGCASHRRRPALTILVGLPGSGKSRVAEELHARIGAAVLESDAMRHLLFPQPSYSAEESRSLFAAIHDAIDGLLAGGSSVILDATNLVEEERAPLYRIVERRNARLVLALVTAPDGVIRRRLARRGRTNDSRPTRTSTFTSGCARGWRRYDGTTTLSTPRGRPRPCSMQSRRIWRRSDCGGRQAAEPEAA